MVWSTPNRACAGATVTIDGRHLEDTVEFNGINANTSVQASATSTRAIVTARVPDAVGPGPAKIIVYTASGNVEHLFEVQSCITDLELLSTCRLRIAGTDFPTQQAPVVTADNSILLTPGPSGADFVEVDLEPSLEAGVHDFRVGVQGSMGPARVEILYPCILAVTPAAQCPGQEVVIEGRMLGPNSKVFFGLNQSDTPGLMPNYQLKVRVPNDCTVGAPADDVVVWAGPSGAPLNSSGTTFETQACVTGMSTECAISGAPLAIYGTGFAEGAVSVTICDIPVTPLFVTKDTIRICIPPGQSSPCQVCVQVVGQTLRRCMSLDIPSGARLPDSASVVNEALAIAGRNHGLSSCLHLDECGRPWVSYIAASAAGNSQVSAFCSMWDGGTWVARELGARLSSRAISNDTAIEVIAGAGEVVFSSGASSDDHLQYIRIAAPINQGTFPIDTVVIGEVVNRSLDLDATQTPLLAYVWKTGSAVEVFAARPDQLGSPGSRSWTKKKAASGALEWDGKCSVAVNDQDLGRIAYVSSAGVKVTTEDPRDTWTTSPAVILSGNGGHVSLAIDPNNHLYVVYSDEPNPDYASNETSRARLRMRRFDGSWSNPVPPLIDQTGYSNVGFSSQYYYIWGADIGLDSSNQPVVSYYHYEDHAGADGIGGTMYVRFWRLNGPPRTVDQWSLASAPVRNSQTSITLGQGDDAHMTYYDPVSRSLKYFRESCGGP